MKAIKLTNIHTNKVKVYSVDKFIKKLNKSLIDIEGYNIEVVKVSLQIK